MSIQRKNRLRRERRAFRVRNRLRSKGIKPRISVFRSLKQIYVQIIDDNEHKTLVSFSSFKIQGKSKKDISTVVGEELGKKAVELGIKDVFFDRGKYRYHGRLRALAEGLRSSGLNF
jgi:large subunit ribosomal protein L18